MFSLPGAIFEFEVSDMQVFNRPQAGRAFFEGLIRITSTSVAPSRWCWSLIGVRKLTAAYLLRASPCSIRSCHPISPPEPTRPRLAAPSPWR